ncbi:MAG TPA: ABC transporter permease subunit [Pseudonocardiaceae bacterium]|nr:ABC transporter permease subunit [Pseudonocardiaceae bacterium]
MSRFRFTAALTWIGTGGFLLGLFGAIAMVLLSSFAARWSTTWLPGGYTARWYGDAWSAYGVPGMLAVTFEVALAVVALSLVVALPIAYVLARLEFAGKRPVLLLFLLPQVIPTMSYAVPLATFLYRIHLAETLPGVILVNLVPSLPFAVLVLVPFVEQIDPRVEQAARVHGAGTSAVFRRILAPLLIPGLLAAGVLVLVRVVGQFELTFLVAGPDTQTLVVALYNIATQAGNGASPQEVDSMAVVYMLTTLVLLLIALRFVDPTTITRRRAR